MIAEKNDAESRLIRGYTEPLGLMTLTKRPPISFDVVPVLDLLVIALLFSLLFILFLQTAFPIFFFTEKEIFNFLLSF